MSAKYKINPDFVVLEPTPADRFYSPPDPGTPEKRRELIEQVRDEWRGHGVKQMRVTITDPVLVGDDTGYPPGMWIEGWNDENARQLPFGAAWPTEDSAVWPPLTYIASAIEAGTATDSVAGVAEGKSASDAQQPPNPSRRGR